MGHHDALWGTRRRWAQGNDAGHEEAAGTVGHEHMPWGTRMWRPEGNAAGHEDEWARGDAVGHEEMPWGVKMQWV